MLTQLGLSMNVIHCVHVHYTQAKGSNVLRMEILNFGSTPPSPPLKQRVLRLINEKVTTSEQIAQINYQLGEQFAQAIHAFCAEYEIDLASQVDLISSHGQIIWHLPIAHLASNGNSTRTHLEMAEMAIIAARTGKTTVGHFRVGDQAYGRQGGPLTAFLDSLLLVDPHVTRVCQGIGDIATTCFIPAGDVEGCYQYDSGPGTILIDAAVRYFTDGEKENDENGLMGLSGAVQQQFVDEFLTQPYFAQSIPKSCGREMFCDSVSYDLCERMSDNAISPDDCVATITRITAQSILQHFRMYAPVRGIDEIFLYGEGSLNPNIVDYLRQELPTVRLRTLEEIGIPGEAKEAVAFAQLGLDCLLGRPTIVPQRVETRAPAIIGQIQPGRNWRKLVRHASTFWDDEQLESSADCVTELVILRDSV
jgi:1,6-anhydro-N-acetylmuramate kinase